VYQVVPNPNMWPFCEVVHMFSKRFRNILAT
jgi:hypothetical protein